MPGVTVTIAQGTRRAGALLLADISGYTAFLQGVTDAHRDWIIEAPEPPPAYAVLSHLLDAMLAAITPSFRLAKFEGDAIFAVADGDMPMGAAMIDCLRGCYATFRERLGAAASEWTCSCAACSRIGALDLKFVLHHGSFVAQSIAGHEELLGPEVNLVHRLLKNRVRELVGTVPYALLTDSAVTALAIPTDGMVAAKEVYEDMPPVPVRVLVL
jgi:hypothetical protein